MSMGKNSTQIKNSLLLVLEQAVIILSTFGFTVFAARSLSLEDYGTLSLAQYFFTFFGVFLTLSLNAITFQRLCEDINCSDEVLGSAYITQLLSSTFIAGILYCYYYLSDYKEDTVLLVLMFGLVNIFRRADLFQVYWKAKEFTIRSTVGRIVARLLGGLYLVAIYFSESVTILSIVGYFIVEALSYLILMHLSFKQDQRSIRFKFSVAVDMLNRVKSEIPNNFILSIALSLPLITLEKIYGAEAIAPLSLALLCLSVFMNLANSFCDGFYHKMVNDNNSKSKFVGFYIRITFTFAALVFCCNILFGDYVITFVFGEKYSTSHDVFVWVSAFLFISLPTRVLFRLVYMGGLQRFNKYRVLPASVLSILSSIYIIPEYGIYGAIFSLAVYYLVGDLLGYFFKKQFCHIGLVFFQSLVFKEVK